MTRYAFSESTGSDELLFIQPDQNRTTLNSENNLDRDIVDPNDIDKKYANQTIVGTAHPRTEIKPIIPLRPYDFTEWHDTPYIAVMRTNTKRPQYPNLAGYAGNSETDELVDNIVPYKASRQNFLQKTKQSPLIQTLQPGVYTLPDYSDPINANAQGTAYVPQFEPIRKIRENGNVVFAKDVDLKEQYPTSSLESRKAITKQQSSVVDRNKSLSPSGGSSRSSPNNRGRHQSWRNRKKHPTERDVTTYNVFDPRFTGYGSSDRAYLEPMLNQTRFYYDDIDAIRRPNYLVRSKLDSCITAFGDTYGPQRNNVPTLNETRSFAERSYLENNLSFRNDMMESLLRKRNEEMWQVRSAPKYTMRQSR